MYDLTKSDREREGLLFGCFNLSLGGGGGGSIQSHFVTDISVKFGIPNSLQVPDIGPNIGRGISHFQSIPYKRKLS